MSENEARPLDEWGCFVVCYRVALIFMFMSVVFVCLLSLFVPL